MFLRERFLEEYFSKRTQMFSEITQSFSGGIQYFSRKCFPSECKVTHEWDNWHVRFFFASVADILAILLTDVLVLLQEKDQRYVFSTVVSASTHFVFGSYEMKNVISMHFSVLFFC